ncbi:MAG: hypothetical protein J7K83_02805 [Candidatus Aenigmarchaeota archaeon]|nr:hypothetical protein [Candidatus Aenigmarchaeota archaeon]
MDEYEVVPVNPVRRLEKRIEKLESLLAKETGKEFVKEIVDIIKMNQLIVDELVRSNESLKMEISKLPGRLDTLISQINELLSYVKASITEEVFSPESLRPFVNKMEKIAEGIKELTEVNKMLMENMSKLEKKLESSVQQKPMVLPRRIPIQKKPTILIPKKQ